MLVIDVLALVLAVHALATYHARPNKPTIMPLGTLLTFILCGLLLALLALISLARVRGERQGGQTGR